MSELRDLYDINSNKTDRTYYKGEIIPEGSEVEILNIKGVKTIVKPVRIEIENHKSEVRS